MKKGDLIDFTAVKTVAVEISNTINEKKDELISILTRYETYKTALDETDRSLDLLDNIEENKEYFYKVVGSLAVFMPSNQPLYAFTCFALIPSLISDKVSVKVPQVMEAFYEDMVNLLDLDRFELIIELLKLPRKEILNYFTAKSTNNLLGELIPNYEAVIFTGSTKNADLVRKKFDPSVLFITNGSGHNPIIITNESDIRSAVNSVVRICTYNQGQDCAAPNSILVHRDIYNRFLELLRHKVNRLVVGNYVSPDTDVGPISRPDTINRITEVISKNSEYLDPTTPGKISIANSIVEPTIILKPLKDGGNFEEVFAPVFFVQKYDIDDELSKYFEDPRYYINAMYITIYGESIYLKNYLADCSKGGSIHGQSSILKNTDLHQPGVERGFIEYGGYSRGASSISMNNNVIAQPTLPQRELYLYLAKKQPFPVRKKIASNNLKVKRSNNQVFDKSKEANRYLYELSKVFSIEMIRWLIVIKKISIDKLKIDNSVFGYYDTFDEYLKETEVDNDMITKLLGVKFIQGIIPFKQLVHYGSVANWNKSEVIDLLSSKNYSIESIESRFYKAKYWYTEYAKIKHWKLLDIPNFDYARVISLDEKEDINQLIQFLSSREYSLEEIKLKLYEVVNKGTTEADSARKYKQKLFFKNIYNLLFGEDYGPRLGRFFYTVDKSRAIYLLDIINN